MPMSYVAAALLGRASDRIYLTASFSKAAMAPVALPTRIHFAALNPTPKASANPLPFQRGALLSYHPLNT
jgi:hypothetical protein